MTISRTHSSLVVLATPNGAKLEWGNNPIPRKGESVTILGEDARRAGGSEWRVEDVSYLVLEDEVRIEVLLRG